MCTEFEYAGSYGLRLQTLIIGIHRRLSNTPLVAVCLALSTLLMSADVCLIQPSMSPSLAPPSQRTDHLSIAEVVSPDASTAAIVADNAFSAIDAVVAIAKEVGEMFDDVPIVKSVAGIVL